MLLALNVIIDNNSLIEGLCLQDFVASFYLQNLEDMYGILHVWYTACMVYCIYGILHDIVVFYLQL